MKKSYLTVIICLATLSSFAQKWQNSTVNSANINNTNAGNVGIGTNAPQAKLHINGSIRGDQVGGALRIQTDAGYVNIGALNSLFVHFNTDRVAYYFDRELHVEGGIIKSHTQPLQLWSVNTLGLTILDNGRIGVGTSTPIAKFDVVSQDDWHLKIQNTKAGGGDWRIGSLASDWGGGGGKFLISSSTSDNSSFVIDNQKRVGIGVLNPETRLHVSGGVMSLDGSTPTIYTGSGTGELNRYLALNNSPTTPTPSGLKAGGMLVSDTYTYANPTKNDLIVKGNVSIGTPNVGNYMLAVNGKIGAKEVRVERTSSAWPDYVFTSTYSLPALCDVEQYIRENRHLQDVPSATEVEKQGHDLGEMDAILLRRK